MEINDTNIKDYVISIKATITPVHALRMIEIELPCRPFASFNKKRAYNSKIKTQKTGHTYYFKTEYDKIGRGKKYMEGKHA